MKNNTTIFLLIFSISIVSYSQEAEEVDIFIINSFVTPEVPHTFNLSFFTSEAVKASIKIDDKDEIIISDKYLEDHSAQIDFTNYKFTKSEVPYIITVEDESGNKTISEINEIILPYDEFIETKEGSNPVTTLLFGMGLWLLPSPNLIIYQNENYFGITKEIPIVTFYSSGYAKPAANISLEYSHVYNVPIADFLRVGYKQIYYVDYIEFISPGVNIFTNFNGFNGVGTEVSLGIFSFFEAFTVYSKYRYNFQPSNTNNNFHEVSLGLYSHFFTIDL
ncbi:MAG: hypothetical protein GY936_01795 [Ignavibacteriae bacterium]|nr:hypothetical protein [Ignavibacteriota bacterium]